MHSQHSGQHHRVSLSNSSDNDILHVTNSSYRYLQFLFFCSCILGHNPNCLIFVHGINYIVISLFTISVVYL